MLHLEPVADRLVQPGDPPGLLIQFDTDIL